MSFDDIEDQQLEESKSIDDGNKKSRGRPKGSTKQLIRGKKETVNITKYRIICRYLHEIGVHYNCYSTASTYFFSPVRLKWNISTKPTYYGPFCNKKSALYVESLTNLLKL